MNKTFFSVLFTAAMPFLCFPQIKLHDINTSTQAIQLSISTYKKVDKTNYTGGIRSAFFDGNELRLISAIQSDSTTEKKITWYYANSQLAYCETNWFDNKTHHLSFNEKLYLDKSRLIAWSNSRDGTIDPSSREFKKMDSSLVAYGKRIQDEALK